PATRPRASRRPSPEDPEPLVARATHRARFEHAHGRAASSPVDQGGERDRPADAATSRLGDRRDVVDPDGVAVDDADRRGYGPALETGDEVVAGTVGTFAHAAKD